MIESRFFVCAFQGGLKISFGDRFDGTMESNTSRYDYEIDYLARRKKYLKYPLQVLSSLTLLKIIQRVKIWTMQIFLQKISFFCWWAKRS